MEINIKNDNSHVWGEFDEFIWNQNNIVRLIKIKDACSTSEHSHNLQDEFYYVISGNIEVSIDEHKYLLKPGDYIEIDRNKKHLVYGVNTTCGYSMYMEIVSTKLKGNFEQDIIRYREAQMN